MVETAWAQRPWVPLLMLSGAGWWCLSAEVSPSTRWVLPALKSWLFTGSCRFITFCVEDSVLGVEYSNLLC